MSPHANSENEPEDPTALFPEPPREHLINTAVKFLQNPRVRPTSLSHKQKFLKQKGLTDEEIELACQKAGAFALDKSSMSGPLVVARPYYEKPSIWIKAKDVANLVALFSIGSYSLYSLWKRYIAPRLFGTRSRNEQNYQSLLAAISALNQNVMELKELIRELQAQGSTSSQKARQSYELQEIKSELTSIKSLLLSRSQFPSTPPSIPAWQMLGGEPSDEHNPDDEAGDVESAASRRRKGKSQKSQVRKGEDNPKDILSLSEAGSSTSGGTSAPMRKHPSVDSNNGFHSGSSCEVVFVGGKNDSEPDHSDD
jgi:peroxin-14